MKVMCIMSHEQPTAGGFMRYEAGREYDVENPEPKFFDLSKDEKSPDIETGRFPIKSQTKKGGKRK